MTQFGKLSPPTALTPRGLPTLHRIDLKLSPLQLFSKLERSKTYAYILESAEGPKHLAEYSFIGFDPSAVITVKNKRMVLDSFKEEPLILDVDDPLRTLALIFEKQQGPRAFRLMGGAVGHISYDAIRYWETLPDLHEENGFPEMEFAVYDDGVVYDHVGRGIYYYHYGEDRRRRLEESMDTEAFVEPFKFSGAKTNVDRDEFEASVIEAKKYISSGDILQAVLSKRYDMNVHGNPLSFYAALHRVNPSPYMFLLKMGDRRIVGSSPEMLVRVEGKNIETYPIAGTRRVTENEKENQRLAEELISDTKERAEHVMLVDLARNDLGKVCKFGSIHVPEFMRVERFSHVQHIVSKVKGVLDDDQDCFGAVRAVFPAGTVSGAPKVRAMEIIEELEKCRRGPYAGAVGYFSFTGDADFAITIRTLVSQGSKAHIQSGAGIVADSVPQREWVETEEKASALFAAFETEENKI